MLIEHKPKRRVFKWIWIATIIGVSFYFLASRNTTPLMPWHTARLSEEFTEGKLDSTGTFNQYLQLEERLYNELEQKVYGKTASGKDHELNRYSSGSAADPHHHPQNWNRSFELPSDSPVGAVLLLHGMSDSPYSLRALGETFHKHGYWVIGLRLPGHGTTPSGLKKLQWEDMAAAVELAAAHLKSKISQQPLHLVGYSTGAPLALNFTIDALDNQTEQVPASLILISPAIAIHPAAGLARFKDWLSRVPGLGHLAWLSIEPEFDPYKYNSFATNAANQVHRITSMVSRRIENWSKNNPPEKFPPVLIFKSTVDATVSVDAVVDRLLTPLSSKNHELVLFDINRLAAISMLLAADPGPLTGRLMNDNTLPFVLTLVTNENPDSKAVVARRKIPLSNTPPETTSINLQWPQGVISLSHVALPFPPDDPLYGQRPPAESNTIFLGHIEFKGERNLLKIPYNWLIRLRHNPFYEYLEERSINWVERGHVQ